MATIDKCISRIDEPDNLAKLLIETGAHHRKYKVPADYIQVGKQRLVLFAYMYN